MDFKEWLDVIDGLGTLGILVAIAYLLRKENGDVKEELKRERSDRIIDLKKHNENAESLLEKVLVALQDNQRFLEISLTTWKQEIKDELYTIKQNILK